MGHLYMRLVAIPVAGPSTPALASLKEAGDRVGSVGVLRFDADLRAMIVSVRLHDAPREAFAAIASALRGVGDETMLRFELLAEDDADASPGIEQELAGALSALGEALVVRRTMAASAWARARPIKVFFPGNEPRIAIEIGRPTVLLKVRLPGVPAHGLVRLTAAVAGAESGFSDVGATHVVAQDGTMCLLLEFSDLARAPLHRVLDVLDIEARRYGGRLGETELLSHVPLKALLGTLAGRLNLSVAERQVIETHLRELHA